MKKTFMFMKTLLVAAGLLMGASAWADEVTFTQVASYNFDADGATDPFTNRTWSNRQTSTLEQDATLGTKAVVFKGSNLAGKTSGYHTLDFDELTGSSSQVKVEFDFYVNEANIDRFALRDASIAEEPTKDSWKGTGAIFSIGCARVKEGSVNVNRFGYNGKSISGAAFSTPYHVSIIVDVVNKKVAYTLKKISDNSTVASESDIAFTDANATACTRLDFHGATNATMAAINNIVISEYTSSSATTYSVIKYDKDGNELSSTNYLVGVAGETSSATVADKANFYSADTNSKYVYDESDERNVTSLELTSNEATNVLKLYFNTYAKYTATVSSVCGSNEVADITGSWYGDETPKTLYWPKVVSCPDGYYIVDAEASAPRYGHTFSSSDLTKTVTYTLDDDIVYYAEYESILTDKNSFEYFPEHSSKGTSRCLQKSGVMKTAMGLTQEGLYDVTFACGNRDGGHTASLELKMIDSENNISTENVISASFSGSEWKGELTAVNVTIPAGSELYLANDNGTGNAKIAGDYILVRKVNNSYAASYYNDANWENVYAYVWTTEDASTKRLGAWPGTKIEATDGVYNVSILGNNAPTKIIFNNGNSGEGNQTANLDFEDGASYNSQGKLNTYTATFTTNLGWDKVCAYVWSGDGDGATKFNGNWPGNEITATDGIYTVSVLANSTPEKIIFNNGDTENMAQTSDLTFEDGGVYTWNAYTVTFKNTVGWENVYAWIWNGTNENLNAPWPGTQLSGNEGLFPFTYTGIAAPEHILFHNNLSGDDNQTSDFDFEDGTIYTKDGIIVSKTITAAGYATYFSDKALSFTGTGLTAYIAKAGETKDIEFVEVSEVPANTGVLLKGEAGNYDIPVVAEAAAVTGNLFEGVLESTEKAAGTVYVLMANPSLGFYKNKNAFTLSANSAYIPVDAVATGRSFIAIDDENTTSISNVNVNLNDNMVYNLNGQRVNNAQKGLYIINGKKVVIK